MSVKTFRIVMDGVEHIVEVEELGGVSAPAPAAVSAAPAPAPAPKKKASAAPSAGDILAPLQGTVSAVNVKAGDSVKEGQIVAIIEAMKMENEIAAPRDAVVAGVSVNPGDKVNADDLLISLK
ncbi:MAG: biotin/lipoyl-binding protein [Solobacterium sp.]|nr:biotin/lipoyl-binding protein [Solobacterium sp.]